MEKNNLNEMFAVPFNSKLVAIFDNKIKLYTSPFLIKQYKKALASTKYTAPSFPLLNDLIDKQTVIPVYMSQNILSYSFHKIFGHNNALSGALAFYDPSSNKIFVLIDMNTTLGFVSDKWISKLTVHEMMHMACAHGKDNFKKLFINEYKAFYNHFFHLLAEEHITTKTTKDIAPLVNQYIDTFHKIEVHSADLKVAITKKGFNIIYKVLKYFNIDEKIIQNVQDGYKYILIMYIQYGVAGLIKAMQYKQCKYILQQLKHTYKSLTNIQPDTLAIQELLFPSEIIAVLSETGVITKKTPAAIKMIKK